jgi:hypothetical protein
VQLPLIELPEMFRQSLGASTTPGWLGRHMLSLEIDVCIPDIFLFMHLDTICSEAHISQMFIAVGMCCLGGWGCYFSEVTWEFFQWSMEKYW